MKTVNIMKLMMIIILTALCYNISAPVFDFETHLTNREQFKDYQEKVLFEIMVANILSTIRNIESSGDYQSRGASGEYGAYQFTPATWKYWNQKLGYDIDITDPASQDEIAEQKIRYLLDLEYTIEQIAAFWNSGQVDYKGRIGVNKYGVRYNVPAYVEKFVEKFKIK